MSLSGTTVGDLLYDSTLFNSKKLNLSPGGNIGTASNMKEKCTNYKM